MKTLRNSAQFIDEVFRLLSTAAHVSYYHVVPVGHWPYPITVCLTSVLLHVGENVRLDTTDCLLQ